MCANSDVGYDCTIVIPPYIHSSISRNGFVIDLRSCPLLTLYTKILASRDQIWLPGLWIFRKHGRDFLVRIVILNNWNNLRLLLYIDTRQYSLWWYDFKEIILHIQVQWIHVSNQCFVVFSNLWKACDEIYKRNVIKKYLKVQYKLKLGYKFSP